MITKFSNILSIFLYEKTILYLDNLKKNKAILFSTSFLNWKNELIKNSAPILRYDFNENDIDIFYELKKEIEDKIPYIINTATFHLYPNLSYITWHDDHNYDAALTIFLNENWDEDWGGYLMYKENNEIKAIKPEKNMGVLQENSIEHCVTTNNIGAPIRTTLQ